MSLCRVFCFRCAKKTCLRCAGLPLRVCHRTDKELALFGEGGYQLAVNPLFQDVCEKIELRSATDNPDKPLFLKRLSTFWALNPQYSSSNTLMIENDVEKVDLNPAGNILCPAEWKAAGQGKDDRFLHPTGDFCTMLRELAKCEDIPTFA